MKRVDKYLGQVLKVYHSINWKNARLVPIMGDHAVVIIDKK